jgi:Zn-dependent peptidase ImmA (M78 family)
MDRKALVRQGMQAAADLRDQLDLDQFAPVDPYRAAELLGVKVVFLGASMEGFYFKQKPARILLSGLRPVPRRAFTCAHELGHHIFGHGSTIDQLQDDERPDSDKPDEILANAFAAFFLMPSVGVRGAFARRGWKCETATPVQLYTVACEFGVGYVTLVNHLSYTLRDIDAARRKELERWTPQRIRRELIEEEYDSLTLVDDQNEAASFDVEKGAAVLLPMGIQVAGKALKHVGQLKGSELYRAAKRGRAKASGTRMPFEVRVMPKPYEGAAANRFLEDPDED